MRPEDVAYIQNPTNHPWVCVDDWGRIHKDENIGRVVDGDWDASVGPWDELAFHSGFQDHFLRGIPWKETEFFRQVTTEGDDWNERWSNSRWEEWSNESNVLDALQSYDELFESIRSDGYRTSPILDELTVNIGRNGELIHNNSASHRLSIAKILDIERIPARVLIRHRDWQTVRSNAESEDGRQAGSHPDLLDVR